MKTNYRPCELNNGKELFPNLANRSDRVSGFTNGTIPQPEFLNRQMGDVSQIRTLLDLISDIK